MCQKALTFKQISKRLQRITFKQNSWFSIPSMTCRLHLNQLDCTMIWWFPILLNITQTILQWLLDPQADSLTIFSLRASIYRNKKPTFLNFGWLHCHCCSARLLYSENLIDMKEKTAEIQKDYLIYVTLCEWKHG